MDNTARLDLPLLALAQAAKEMTVNEAMTVLDIAVQPVVAGEASAPPVSPDLGECWLVADAATGAFAGREGAIAAWTAGGWRFVSPFEGMTVWRRDTEMVTRRGSATWSVGPAIVAPSGGAMVDTEARAAINTIIDRMRVFGIVAA